MSEDNFGTIDLGTLEWDGGKVIKISEDLLNSFIEGQFTHYPVYSVFKKGDNLNFVSFNKNIRIDLKKIGQINLYPFGIKLYEVVYYDHSSK